jgi:hypothetical protein
VEAVESPDPELLDELERAIAATGGHSIERESFLSVPVALLRGTMILAYGW